MGSSMENPTNTAKLPSAASAAAASRPQRWSARRKQEIVLRLLRGEPIEAIARELGVVALGDDVGGIVFFAFGGLEASPKRPG